jgi:hypothetical protein
MSETTSSIWRELALQNHKIWVKINYAITKVLRKTNPTTSKNNNHFKNEVKPEQKSNRFLQAVRRIEFKYGFEPNFTDAAPYGYFRSRHIIGETTKINKGIFVSAIPGEAIVIDEKYGVLNDVYLKLISRVSILDNNNSSYEYQVFSKVIALTRETLRYSEENVENITRQYRIDFDEKVSLDLYIKKKVGVARHQVLLAAYLLEKLKEKYLIKGTHWIDQTFSSDAYNERLVFKSADGEIFRFDPTKGLGKTAIH